MPSLFSSNRHSSVLVVHIFWINLEHNNNKVLDYCWPITSPQQWLLQLFSIFQGFVIIHQHSCFSCLSFILPWILMDNIWEGSEWHEPPFNLKSLWLAPHIIFYLDCFSNPLNSKKKLFCITWVVVPCDELSTWNGFLVKPSQIIIHTNLLFL